MRGSTSRRELMGHTDKIIYMQVNYVQSLLHQVLRLVRINQEHRTLVGGLYKARNQSNVLKKRVITQCSSPCLPRFRKHNSQALTGCITASLPQNSCMYPRLASGGRRRLRARLRATDLTKEGINHRRANVLCSAHCVEVQSATDWLIGVDWGGNPCGWHALTTAALQWRLCLPHLHDLVEISICIRIGMHARSQLGCASFVNSKVSLFCYLPATRCRSSVAEF